MNQSPPAPSHVDARTARSALTSSTMLFFAAAGISDALSVSSPESCPKVDAS